MIDFSPLVGNHLPEDLFENSTRSQLFVCDNAEKGYSCFVVDTKGLGSNKTLIIQNPNHKDVTLVRIDGVLFERMSRCDCAVMFENEFDFVELKTNAANKTEESMEAQYDKSVGQLKITIKEFESRFMAANISFKGLFDTVRAYSVFNPSVPSNNATQKKYSSQFAKELKIILQFTNRIKI